MNSQRLKYIDLGAGIMILWMIVYHAIGASWAVDLHDILGTIQLSNMQLPPHAYIGADGYIRKENPCIVFPYLNFFMPWFFYKSGMLFKKTDGHTLWNKDKKKLLGTYFLWSAIGYIIFVFFSILSHTFDIHNVTYSVFRGFLLTGRIPLNFALWFLLSLFFVRRVANYILPSKENRLFYIFGLIIVICSGMVAYLAYMFNHRLLPFYIANSASGLSFFTLGYLLKDIQYSKLLFCLSAIVYITCCIFGFPYVIMMSNTLVSGPYMLWIPVSLCGIVFFNNLCYMLCERDILPPLIRTTLARIGQNAMPIYVTHELIYESITNIILTYGDEFIKPFALWIILAVYALFLPIICLVLYKSSN